MTKKERQTIQNYQDFIRYGTHDTKPRDQLLIGTAAICFLALLAASPGLFCDGVIRYVSVAAAVLSIAHLITAAIVTRELSLERRVLLDAVNGTAVTVVYSLVGLMYFLFFGIPGFAFLCLIPLLLGGISLLGCCIKCQNNMYLGKKNKKEFMNLAIFASLGYGLSHLFLAKMTESLLGDEVMVLAALLTLAGIFAVAGAPSFLKLHYIKILKNRGFTV